MKISKKTIFCLFALLLFAEHLCAQQLPVFTQYREYHSYLNPAILPSGYVEQDFNINVGVSYRTFLSSLDQAPAASFLKFDYILTKGNNFDLAVGAYVLNFDTDPIKTTGFYGKIAGLLGRDPYYGTISVGLTFGMVQYRVDTDGLLPFHLNDPVVVGGNPSQITPDVGLGVWFYKRIADGLLADDSYRFGISMPQFLQLDARFTNEDGSFQIAQKRHVYVTGAFQKYLSELSFVELSTWIRYVPNAPLVSDFNVRYSWRKNLWAGLGYSTNNILHVEVGTSILNQKSRSVRIGYGFDVALGAVRSLFSTGHEINVSLMFD